MRFYFDLDDDMMEYYNARDFQGEVQRAAVQAVADKVIKNIDRELTADEARIVIRGKTDQIINAIVERVSARIIEKKELKALIPSASELSKADREVQKYFEQMIDRAIARKFNK